MKRKNMKKFNRNQKQRRRGKNTGPSVASTVEGLKIPEYVDRSWCDQLHFTSVHPEEERTYGITHHAQIRMSQRGISKDAMAVVLKYGRKVYAQKAIVYFFGKKEMKKHLKHDQHHNKWSDFRDIHVLVSPSDDTIITTYKNQDISIKADF